jgi:hypothetical protein
MRIVSAVAASTVLLGALMLVSCAESSTQPDQSEMSGSPLPSFVTGSGVSLSATGGGYLFVTNPPLAIGDGQFSFAAAQLSDGSVSGQFHLSRLRDGFVVDFHGEVTCMSVDPVLHRVWVGGVVTQNNSNDPNHTGTIHQPGKDVWFRVVDNGEGLAAAPDRSSVYGFEGAGGVITSAEYCAKQLWTAGGVNAFVVTEGNIQVTLH